MVVDTRQKLMDYCLRALGDDVSPDQVSDRIDDAVQQWQEYHRDRYSKGYVIHPLTATDIENKGIPISDEVLFVTGIVPITYRLGDNSFFSYEYQLHLHDIFDMAYSGGMAQFVQTKQYLSLIGDMIRGKDRIRYSRWKQRLDLDINWGTLVEGSFIVVECFMRVDPEEYEAAWNDQWLKAYATALIQKQWGNNLAKFGGVEILGGVTMNGAEIMAAAKAEIELLEERLISRHSDPIDFFTG